MLKCSGSKLDATIRIAKDLRDDTVGRVTTVDRDDQQIDDRADESQQLLAALRQLRERKF